MKVSWGIKYIVLYTACLLLQNCNTAAKKDAADETEVVQKSEFYAAADFNTVENTISMFTSMSLILHLWFPGISIFKKKFQNNLKLTKQ